MSPRAAVDPDSKSVVAVVQLFQLSPDLTGAETDELGRVLVAGFTADAATTEEQIAGRTALVATNVREEKVAVISVLDGHDVVLLSSPSLVALRKGVGLYFA